VADIKSEQAAGFKSVHVAGFTLECLAGPVGIRTEGLSFKKNSAAGRADAP
jgi:hypothetical protein